MCFAKKEGKLLQGKAFSDLSEMCSNCLSPHWERAVRCGQSPSQVQHIPPPKIWKPPS